MLDDRHRRAVVGIELGDQLESGVGVVDVVERQFLALVLDDRGHDAGTRPSSGVRIEGRPLVRVFAVAQVLRQTAGKGRGAAAR